MKYQIGVWQFTYERRDIRDRSLHPATFPIALAKRAIELFTHKGELIFDPFVGSGTTLLAANDLERNALGIDLNRKYVELANSRLPLIGSHSLQRALVADAKNSASYLELDSVGLILTSPPYANLLNRKRKNKSRRGDERKNDQYLKIEQYSQDLISLAGTSCQICGTAAFITVSGRPYVEAHHLDELSNRNPGNLCTDNVLIVCPTCHAKLHYAPRALTIQGGTLTLRLATVTYDITLNTEDHLRSLLG
jgi:tRNA G10  N-methylase Trm11